VKEIRKKQNNEVREREKYYKERKAAASNCRGKNREKPLRAISGGEGTSSLRVGKLREIQGKKWAAMIDQGAGGGVMSNISVFLYPKKKRETVSSQMNRGGKEGRMGP